MTTETMLKAAVSYSEASRVRLACRGKIWIDLDNSPHVPFFRPVIDELKARGHQLFVTARDAYQVRELMKYYDVEGRVIGKHYGKHWTLKAMGTCLRGIALTALIRRERPDISLCHGSRGCLITSKLLKIPNVTIADYEFTSGIPSMKPEWMILPTIVPGDRFGGASGPQILNYPGLKEDVYLSSFKPDLSLRKRLGIPAGVMVITVRPPASEAHYHNPEADVLLVEVLKRFVESPKTTIILLPRNGRQAEELRASWSQAIAEQKIIIPDHVEDGMNLIWNSDFVISGGGTMNREAAAMGVPVYSIFRGTIGAVDRYLADEGRLMLLETVEDVRTKIKVNRRQLGSIKPLHAPALDTIVQHIETILATEVQARRAQQTNS